MTTPAGFLSAWRRAICPTPIRRKRPRQCLRRSSCRTDHEGANKSIMVVESKIEMQNVLRDRLKKYGYRVLIYSDPQRAIKRFVDDDHQPADCILFCAEHLGSDALEIIQRNGQSSRRPRKCRLCSSSTASRRV